MRAIKFILYTPIAVAIMAIALPVLVGCVIVAIVYSIVSLCVDGGKEFEPEF